MEYWTIVGAVLFLGFLEALSRYVRHPLPPQPPMTPFQRLSPIDRLFASDEDWEGPPML